MEDIAKFELDDVKNFFRTYYCPNNATLVVGGNFNVPRTKDLIEKYFGNIPKGIAVPEVKTTRQNLSETKEIILEDNVQLPRIYLAWHTEKVFSTNDAALDILSDILTSSKNARLQKSLVFEKQIVQDISSFQYSAKLDGSFIIVSTAKPGIELEVVKNEIENGITNLISNGITDDELMRAKNSLKSSYIYSLQKLDLIVDHLNHYNFFLNEPDSFVFDLSRYENVTGEQVVEAAKKYLLSAHIELNIIPKVK
jgi:zinc protease